MCLTEFVYIMIAQVMLGKVYRYCALATVALHANSSYNYTPSNYVDKCTGNYYT